MKPIDQATAVAVLVDEFARSEVCAAVLCPGSRSGGVIASLAGEPRIQCFSAIDERGAGFMALGLAKATGRPAIVSVTSGTAAANLAPAVAEACEARVPLIILTADRPAELRDSGEGQTIDQIGMFGRWARFHELSAFGDTSEEWWRSTACRAVLEALGPRPGPVHLNLPMRDPLIAKSDELRLGRPDGKPWLRPSPASAPIVDGSLGALLEQSRRPVIIAGREERDDLGWLAHFARETRIPLIADVLSGARQGGDAISFWDALLRDQSFSNDHRPDLIVRLGDLPTSKPLRAWMREAAVNGCEVFQFDPEWSWRDPDSTTSVRSHADAKATLQGLIDWKAPDEWNAVWAEADRAAQSALDESTIGEHCPISEPAIAADIHASLPEGCVLVVSASMPIRDLDSFTRARAGSPTVIANRGANGIDGTIATAAGVAATATRPVCLLIGDVAFAHDVGSLALVREAGHNLLIFVVDNDGGGIFDFLPVGGMGGVSQRFITTPPRIDVASAAKAWGIPASSVSSRAELRRLAGSLGNLESPAVAHVSCPRANNVDTHMRAFEAVAKAIR